MKKSSLIRSGSIYATLPREFNLSAEVSAKNQTFVNCIFNIDAMANKKFSISIQFKEESERNMTILRKFFVCS
jgi:hypothetical protein